MKRLLIIGNWKMNFNVHEASLHLKRLNDHIKPHRNIEVAVAPNMLTLQPLAQEIDRRKIVLAAQNAYFKDEGAYTGEVSFAMLRGLVEYALVGHSERRIYFHETLEVVRDKVTAAIRNDIKPVLFVGENSQEKAAGETKRVIHDQLTTALSNLTAEDLENVVIAYEPIWAISTFEGKLAKPSEIKPIIELIRYNVSELYGKKAAENLRVLYGGSVDNTTSNGYLEIEGVDGVVPGGASLNYHKFSEIVNNAYRLISKDEPKD